MKRHVNVIAAVAIVTLLAAGTALAQPAPPLALAGGAPLPSAAQNGPGGPGAPQQAGPPPDAILKNVLGFTDEQLAALKTLLDTRQQTMQTLGPQIADAEKALNDALAGTNPDPANLGTLLLQVKALREQVTQANQTLAAGVIALLTTAQQQKVNDILSLEKSLSAAPILHNLGF
jgi:Spy/CpxP family protein refolding chaperone